MCKYEIILQYKGPSFKDASGPLSTAASAKWINTTAHRSDFAEEKTNTNLCKSGFTFPVARKEKSESDGELHQLAADLKFIFTMTTQRTQEQE